jgi:hypothetical protein
LIPDTSFFFFKCWELDPGHLALPLSGTPGSDIFELVFYHLWWVETVINKFTFSSTLTQQSHRRLLTPTLWEPPSSKPALSPATVDTSWGSSYPVQLWNSGPGLAQVPQDEGSVPKTATHFRCQLQVCASDWPWLSHTPSLGSIHILEWLTELRKKFLDFFFF